MRRWQAIARVPDASGVGNDYISRASSDALNNYIRPLPLVACFLPYSIFMVRYGITRIRLSADGTHIDAVEYRAIIHGRHARWQVGPPIQITRLGIVDIVRTPGNLVITLPQDANGNYDSGQPVFIEVGPNGIEYLESVADGIERYNLRALPTF